MDFGRPDLLWLFRLLIPIAFLAAFRFHLKRKMRRRMGRMEKLGKISRIRNLPREAFHSLTLLAVVALTIGALAEPRLVQTNYEPVYRGVDMVFLLDTSPSMGASDILPSRLAQAREIIKEFLLYKANDDRAALVGFSDSSMIYSYLTSDPASLVFYFDMIDIGEESLYGTNLGAAIRSGMNVVSRERVVNPEAAARQTALILISDGDDHAGEVLEALQEARQMEMKIYAIGIGSRRGAPIPIREAGHPQFLVDEFGTRITSVLHEEILKSIATTTGARYFQATSPEQLKLALSQILVQQRAVQGYQQKDVAWELYPYFLIAAFLGSLGLLVV
jgi:Ca-activated chloride channel homolog